QGELWFFPGPREHQSSLDDKVDEISVFVVRGCALDLGDFLEFGQDFFFCLFVCFETRPHSVSLAALEITV
ncbi:hypothetical protein ACQP3D_30970, partial [Escherichia coli]